jgi:hypothetical protein
MENLAADVLDTYQHGFGTAHITSYGTKTPNLIYRVEHKTLSLRLGWAGYYNRRNGDRFSFEIKEEQHTKAPLFVVRNHQKNTEHSSTNPSAPWKDSKFVTGKSKVPGPTMFLLDCPILEEWNDSRCRRCPKEPKTKEEKRRQDSCISPSQHCTN